MILLEVDRLNAAINNYFLPIALSFLSIYDLVVYFNSYENECLLNLIYLHLIVAVIILLLEGLIFGKIYYGHKTRERKWKKLINDAKNTNLIIKLNALTKICELLSLNVHAITRFFTHNGTVTVFLTSLNTADVAIQCKALNGLQSIALCTKRYAQHIVDADGAPKLIKLLQSNSSQVCEYNLSLLTILTKCEFYFCDQCISDNIFSKLMKFATPEAWLEHARITAKFISDFCKYSNSPFNDKTMVQLTPLMEKLREYPNKEVKDEALSALSYMVKNGNNPAKIVSKRINLGPVKLTPKKKPSTNHSNVIKCKSSVQQPPTIQQANEDDSKESFLDSKFLSMSSINTEVACELLDELNNSDDDSSHSNVSQHFLCHDFLISSEEELESENSDSDIVSENRIQSNLEKFEKDIMDYFESRKYYLNDCQSESNKSLNDHESVEREFPMNPFELNPDFAELCPIFVEICKKLFESSKANQKILKYIFRNCCETLSLSHNKIKLECLKCLFTLIITMAEDKIPGLGIQAIIDANLGKILVHLYNTDTDAKVRAETKKLLVKLQSILPVENLPVEIDDILASSDNYDNSELFGGHDSVAENNADLDEIFAFNDIVDNSKVVRDSDSSLENEIVSSSSSDNKDPSDHNNEFDLLRLL